LIFNILEILISSFCNRLASNGECSQHFQVLEEESESINNSSGISATTSSIDAENYSFSTKIIAHLPLAHTTTSAALSKNNKT
jgi:hypothetical protein